MISRQKPVDFQKVSILIPVFNEAATIESLLHSVQDVSVPLKKEIIIIDDGSTDGTGDIVERLAQQHPAIFLIKNQKNSGKGFSKISRIKGLRLYEVGISYHGRSYEEGKKIGWKDGCRAFYVIIKYPV